MIRSVYALNLGLPVLCNKLKRACKIRSTLTILVGGLQISDSCRISQPTGREEILLSGG